MTSINLNLPLSPYPVAFLRNFFDLAQEIDEPVLRHLLGDQKQAVLLTDETIIEHYSETIEARLSGIDDLRIIAFPTLAEDEDYTREGSIEALHAFLDEEGIPRDVLVIAIGGGKLLDLAALFTSVSEEQEPALLFPTTLSAMADYALYPTMLDLSFGDLDEPLTLRPPRAVVIDVSATRTLSEDDFNFGLCLIISWALADGGEFWTRVKDEPVFYSSYSLGELEEFVRMSVRAKILYNAKIEEDFTMLGLADVGASFSFAFRSASGMRTSRGDALARGIDILMALAVKNGFASKETRAEVAAVLRDYGFDLDSKVKFKTEEFLNAMFARLDQTSKIGLPMISQPGDVKLVTSFTLADVTNALLDLMLE
ncbi:MAG: hypothetical protein NUW37_08165 [Planctomycetes bacterium]|nr:hypothetical protein [Planctomycetota bacterium]